MHVTLSAASEEFVRRKLASGEFESADQIVSESLQLLKNREGKWSDQVETGWNEARAGQLSIPDEVRVWMKTKKEDWKAGQAR